jgi:hypothetical protein
VTYTAEWNPQHPVGFHQIRKLWLTTALQEGVVNAGDLKVSQRAAGANMSVDIAPGHAWVQTDADTPDGLAHVFGDIVDNEAVSSSHATLPRVDSVVLQWNETDLPAGTGGDTPVCRVVPGTPTSGATLNNRTGAPGGTGGPAFPGDALLLADVLVPAASTSVVDANIRDRRKWARGFRRRIVDTGGDYTITTAGFSTPTILNAARLQWRVECSGVPLIVRLRGRLEAPAASGGFGALYPLVDGGVPTTDLGTQATTQMINSVAAVAQQLGAVFEWELAPTPGSHLVAIAAQTASGNTILRASATNALGVTIEERIIQNADNGTT